MVQHIQSLPLFSENDRNVPKPFKDLVLLVLCFSMYSACIQCIYNCLCAGISITGKMWLQVLSQRNKLVRSLFNYGYGTYDIHVLKKGGGVHECKLLVKVS